MEAPDYPAVQQLLARYCRAVDLADPVLLAGTFTGNAVIHRADGEVVTGLDAIVDLFRSAAAAVPLMRHYVLNIEQQTDVVHSRFLSVVRTPGSVRRITVGAYRSEIVVLEGEVRIASHQITVDDQFNLPATVGAGL
jgi:hypothetical protein